MIPSQMLKGTLEGCVLAVISRHPTYGYEISRRLSDYGFGNIAVGTIYPLLLRLEKNGSIKAEYAETGTGPQRKYYSITPQGEELLASFLQSFRELALAVQTLLEDNGNE